MEFNLKPKLCVELVLRLGSGIKGWLWSSEVWCHPLSSLHFSPVWLVCPSWCVPPVSCCLPHLVYIRWVSLFYPSSHSVPVSLWALCLTEILQCFIIKLNWTPRITKILSILVFVCVFYTICIVNCLGWARNFERVPAVSQVVVVVGSSPSTTSPLLSKHVPFLGALYFHSLSWCSSNGHETWLCEATIWHAAVPEKPTVAVEPPCCFPPLPFCIQALFSLRSVVPNAPSHC